MEILASDFAQIQKIAPFAIHVLLDDLSEIGLDEARALKKKILKLSAGEQYALILDSGKRRIDISHEAREFLALNKELNEKLICQAHVAQSVSNKLIFHFFVNFHKPPFPVQIFDRLEEAVEWVRKCPV